MSGRPGSLLRVRLLSPAGLLLRAAVLSGLFLAAHVAGLREYTSIISGTSPTAQAPGAWAGILGTTYGVLYFLSVVAVPILILGAGIFLAILLVRKGDRRTSP